MLYQLSIPSLKLTFSLSNPDHTICREPEKKKVWAITREENMEQWLLRRKICFYNNKNDENHHSIVSLLNLLLFLLPK
ncbi:hypothetical protein Hanom_Chr04g00341521 [Helianthus anomalus]